MRLVVLCWVAAFLVVPVQAKPTPEQTYAQLCASCHGKDGKGNTPAGKKAGAKDLTLSKTNPDEIERQIRDGKQNAKARSNMPSFAGKLSDEEIKGLAGYVLKLRK